MGLPGNFRQIRSLRLAPVWCALTLASCGLGLATASTVVANPLAGRSMWIWYVRGSAGGSVSAIVAQARAAGVTNLIVKSGDGSGYWSQFSPGLVRSIHAGGLHACAWQYVYGTHPAAEAAIGRPCCLIGLLFADTFVVDRPRSRPCSTTDR